MTRERRTVEQSPDKDERKGILLSWVDDLEEATLNVLFWTGLEVEKVEHSGCEEGRDEEEEEAEPVLEADDASDGTCEAGGDELDVVYRIRVEENVRSAETLLLLLGGE
jgi:hypothetical protein